MKSRESWLSKLRATVRVYRRRYGKGVALFLLGTIIILFVVIAILSKAPLLGCLNSILEGGRTNKVIEIVELVIAVVAAGFVYMEVTQNKHISEAELVRALNSEFINSTSLSRVEHKLEIYYSKYRDAKKAGKAADGLELELNLDTENEDRQHLVNYLVHLESIAALVNGRILRLSIISDLMAYRFFIAVHNPIIQEVELEPYKEFYSGCYKLHKKWMKEMKKKEMEKKIEMGTDDVCMIPLEEYSDFFNGHKGKQIDCNASDISYILEYIKRFYQKESYANPTAYFYDLTAIRANIERVKNGMPDAVKIYYAMKANPNEAVMDCIRGMEDICGVEIASAGELDRALKYYKGGDILFTGPGKTEYELEQAIISGIKYINVESVTEAYRINEIATRLKIPCVEVLLRVNLNYSEIDEGEKMVGYSTKMGIDEDVFTESFKVIKNLEKICVKGIHAFAVSGVLDYKKLIKVDRYIFNFVANLQKEVGDMQVIDFGGGLGIDYSSKRREFDIENYKRELTELINEYKFYDKEIIMELGTYIAGNAGYYTAKIIDIKQIKGKKHIIIAGGVNHMGLPLEMQRKHPVRIIPMNSPKLYADQPGVCSEVVDISGPLCIVSDKLCWEEKIENAEIGDIVVFYQAGAYCYEEGMHEFLMHSLPMIEIIDY